MTREDYIRCKEDYLAMGFSHEQAEDQSHLDAAKEVELEERRKNMKKKLPKGQTAEEQK